MLVVKCPNCGRNMKTQPRGGDVTTKVKKCVYCGKSFKIHSSMRKSQIVDVLTR
jgi:acetyl-CoA carboxylase beta subunit